MKRISFALLFGYLFGTVAFGQEPGDVVIQPLVDFDDILENIGSMLFGLLQQNLLFCLSLFFVWAWATEKVVEILDDYCILSKPASLLHDAPLRSACFRRFVSKLPTGEPDSAWKP